MPFIYVPFTHFFTHFSVPFTHFRPPFVGKSNLRPLYSLHVPRGN